MLIVIAFLSQHAGAIYADAFGLREAMVAPVEQKRDLERTDLQREAATRVRLILDAIGLAAWQEENRSSTLPGMQTAMIRQLTGVVTTLAVLLLPTGERASSETLRTAIDQTDAILDQPRSRRAGAKPPPDLRVGEGREGPPG